MRRHLLIHLALTLLVAVAFFLIAKVYNNRGFIHRKQGNLDQAIAEYDANRCRHPPVIVWRGKSGSRNRTFHPKGKGLCF